MTPGTAQRPQMSVEDFEELARRAPEGVKLELIDGKPEVKPLPDQRHRAVVVWLSRLFMQQRPELALYPGQGLKVGACRKGHACADGALAPFDHFIAQDGEYADPEGVLLVLEATSHDRDVDELVVHSTPEGGVYQQRSAHPYGATVQLPSPVDITLDTEKLKEYAD